MNRDTSQVAIAIVVRGDEVLTITRRHGAVAFPGGYVKTGESGADAAVRETLEETGIRSEVICPLESRPGGHVRRYLAKYCGGEIRPQLSEICGAGWLPIPEALETLNYVGDRYSLMHSLRRIEQEFRDTV